MNFLFIFADIGMNFVLQPILIHYNRNLSANVWTVETVWHRVAHTADIFSVYLLLIPPILLDAMRDEKF